VKEPTKKLVIIVTKTDFGTHSSLNIEKVGDQSLWFEVKREVIEGLLEDLKMKGLK
jgi:hypothetical protein